MPVSELPAIKNPRKWRFTWESNSHVPILRLYLFNPTTKPSSECTNLKVDLLCDKSLVKVTWLQSNETAESLWVPIPRVLIDAGSPINLRALDDHIEAKFVLILPVDHPIVSNFGFEDGDENALEEDEFQPLQLDSDLKKLASCGEVHFYCRGCSTKLTRAVRFFKEMPSVNWREAADNWFGTCCCSFGGVSEKLVAKYAESYACSSGVCLLDATSVVICKDDFVGYKFPDSAEVQEHKSVKSSGNNSLRKDVPDNGSTDALNVDHGSQKAGLHNLDIKSDCRYPEEGDLTAKLGAEGSKELLDCNTSDALFQKLRLIEDLERTYDIGCCHHHTNEEQISSTSEVQSNNASLLNGLLGNSFMVTSPYLSKDIKWTEVSCPNCSCLLGAYPHDNVDTPLNGFNTAAPLNDRVHLFKCFLSTSLPVGGSTDLFRKYTLERMFTSQLLESANDELSFRTVVRNLQTRSPMLQIVLLNPNSWCSFGDCMDVMVPIPKINMYPMIKVLFSNCSNSTESQLRKLDQWVTKNQVDDVYMMTSKALTESLELANSMLPPSHAYLQGLSLSFLRRRSFN
ncbi:hypothetical protein OSB04_007096 [Centaurea solstitialis]|uniref:Ubiquitin-conjugating enzyme E2C-binding protein n=1 Tax=Centaurea solstitialis TaxID=347529 RepID=A0AA38WT38_9ASTR|nr:hypothetical protein OSB04_007096 [Centaurea solstitialis]